MTQNKTTQMQQLERLALDMLTTIDKWSKLKNENSRELDVTLIDVNFIDKLIFWLKNIDDGCVRNYDNGFAFEGNGSYFGKQISVEFFDLNFEIAYSKKEIAVYTPKHNGFWTPTYIYMEKDNIRFNDLLEAIYLTVKKFTGVE